MAEKESTVAQSPKKGQDQEDKIDMSKIPRDPAGIIDQDILDQIREMDEMGDDDDEDQPAPEEGSDPREFSRSIVFGFFDQAEKTFEDMEKAVEHKDLAQLSSLGHFLKGSSAALGIIRVQAACEKIQHYGLKRDEEAGVALEEDEALKRIDALLKECRKSYVIAKAWLTRLYEEEGKEVSDE